VIVLFVIVERSQERTMLDLTPFQNAGVAGASIVASHSSRGYRCFVLDL